MALSLNQSLGGSVLPQYLLELLYASLATLGFSVVFNIHGKKLVPAVLCGTFGWALFLLVHHLTGSRIISIFIASFFIGLYSEVAARLLKEPATLFIVPGIIPLVPGSGMYYTMAASIQGEISETLSIGMETLNTAGAIAVGVAVAVSLRKIAQTLGNK